MLGQGTCRTKEVTITSKDVSNVESDIADLGLGWETHMESGNNHTVIHSKLWACGTPTAAQPMTVIRCRVA